MEARLETRPKSPRLEKITPSHQNSNCFHTWAVHCGINRWSWFLNIQDTEKMTRTQTGSTHGQGIGYMCHKLGKWVRRQTVPCKHKIFQTRNLHLTCGYFSQEITIIGGSFFVADCINCFGAQTILDPEYLFIDQQLLSFQQFLFSEKCSPKYVKDPFENWIPGTCPEIPGRKNEFHQSGILATFWIILF